MPFASSELVARIERAECSLLTDFAAASAERHPVTGVRVMPVGGGVAVHAGAYSPLNKLTGLGFGGAVDLEELATVERVFADRGSRLLVEVASLADPSVLQMLTQRGYALTGFETVLGRELGGTTRPEAGEIVVERSGEEDVETWFEVVVDGFAAPDAQGVPSHESFPRAALEEVLRDAVSARGLQRYLARRGRVPAGGASMRLQDGIAQLCGAATRPEHRRRGVQTALLAHRLAEAAAAGCELAVVTTLPGSKSQENAQRHGFEVLYARAVLAKEP